MNKIQLTGFREYILLNEVQLRNDRKWSYYKYLWNDLNESYSSNIFLTYSTRTAVK